MTESRNNAVLELIHSHRTVRAFEENRPLDEDSIRRLVAAGQRASTSMGLQPYSVIAVTDQALKDEISDLVNGQAHVRQASVMLVYCIDYSRIAWQVNARGAELKLDPLFMLVNATWDISLMAQNVALAAQSLGLGMSLIGALLGLGDNAVVLLGQAIGYPTETPPQRPRLSQTNILHFNAYTPTGDSVEQQQGLEAHDADHAALPARPGDPFAGMPWSEAKAMALSSGLYADVFTNFRAELARKLGVPSG